MNYDLRFYSTEELIEEIVERTEAKYFNTPKGNEVLVGNGEYMSLPAPEEGVRYIISFIGVKELLKRAPFCEDCGESNKKLKPSHTNSKVMICPNCWDIERNGILNDYGGDIGEF
ncbi:hypothetical protein [Bacillus sp. Marseille-P3800]|uniref:hypothetical protein n=1 Tax=Bacillus sp. Marseille-P3800 TaxID=2014782 RepID=UPI000C085659|nr:hypothetical protein [Bacillus sp. Marseille-P3800]